MKRTVRMRMMRKKKIIKSRKLKRVSKQLELRTKLRLLLVTLLLLKAMARTNEDNEYSPYMRALGTLFELPSRSFSLIHNKFKKTQAFLFLIYLY